MSLDAKHRPQKAFSTARHLPWLAETAFSRGALNPWDRPRKRTAMIRLLPLLFFLSLATAAHAQYTYRTNEGTITITGYNGAGGDVIIPSTIDNLLVTRIGEAAFYSRTNLVSVTLPNGLTSIGRFAFFACTSLTNVIVPATVTSIGDFAFAWCASLTAVTVDALNPVYCSVDGVLFDRNQTTLIQCPGGKTGSYTVPDSVTSIGNSAFSLCTRLTSVTIGDGVSSLGGWAFNFCTRLTKVTLPDSVTSLGTYAFSCCLRLTSITVGRNVAKIESSAFDFCPCLAGVYFKGNAPSVDPNEVWHESIATIYYRAGTTGWGPTFGGRPTMLWNP
jgi:hypothetical protein